MIEYSLVIPAYNESERIVETLRRIDEFRSARKLSAEIIVVDDGSHDATCDKVRQEAVRIRDLRLVESKVNRGKGHAVRLGVQAAQGNKILFTDADNSTPIGELNALDKAMNDSGADIAIGSRYLRHSRVEIRQSRFRILIGRVGNLIVRTFVIKGIQDSQCGFKLFRRGAAKDIFSRCKVDRWGFDIEILALANKLNYKITEVPVSWFNSTGSRLRPVRDAIYTFCELVMIKINLWSGRYENKR